MIALPTEIILIIVDTTEIASLCSRHGGDTGRFCAITGMVGYDKSRRSKTVRGSP